ncbi:hypothetical protein [Natronosalvus rutilus]|uniref:Uncharacterized protein n=1 Tax=Natronosalvus rutilus TaxID=2953753 RepID=A0A9E7SYG0_9EURY|nr:hypothetical protein [Natronosalvus rutilus]UTF55991.1 hypothetical protein NGM29_21090 [Natronosalvus rutilus]
MSAGGSKPRLGLSGRYGIVGHTSGGATPLGQVKELEDGRRRRELVDEEKLDQDSREAVEADDFVIFGKASVEQYDDDTPSQKLKMEALANALPQLYEDGIISRRHKDIPVGTVAPEHELESPAEMQVGDLTLSFDAGDALATQVVEKGEPRPGGAGRAEEDEFWIVAKLKNNSEIAKETRLRALAGDLNGFSVTIYAKEWEETPAGEVVTDLDWHAVTIGEEHKIKNKESRFGVAEFKAFMEDAWPTGLLPGGSDEADGMAEEIHHKADTTMGDAFNEQLFTKSGSELGFDSARLTAAAELAQKADADEGELREKADEVAAEHDLEADAVIETLKAVRGDDTATDQKAGDLTAILDEVEESINPEARIALEAALTPEATGEGGDEGPEDQAAEAAAEGEMKEEEDEVPDDEDEDEKADAGEGGDGLPDGVVTEEKLDERLEEFKADLEGGVTEEELAEKMGDLEESMKGAINEAVPGIVEDIGEKMATGETSDPAGGSTHDQVDYGQDIASNFGSGGD